MQPRVSFRPALVALVVAAGTVGYWLGQRSRAPVGTTAAQRVLSAGSGESSDTSFAARANQATVADGEQLAGADRDAWQRLRLGRLQPAELRRSAEQLLSRHSDPRRDRDLRLTLELLARHDPSFALELANREPGSAVRTLLVAGVVAGWMEHDAASALAWAAGAGEPEWAESAFAALAQFEPERALGLVERLPAEPREFRWNAFRAVVDGRLLDSDFRAAQTLLERAREPGLRLFLAARVADTWARHEPAAAARWAATLPEGDERGQIFVNVGSIWAAQDPQSAADFALGLPVGESRQQMLTHVLGGWVEKDLAAASRWVDRLGAYPENDAAVAAIATQPTLIKVNPEVALSWAESVVGPDARLHAISAIVRQWGVNDGPAARRYVETSARLSAGERAALLVVASEPTGGE